MTSIRTIEESEAAPPIPSSPLPGPIQQARSGAHPSQRRKRRRINVHRREGEQWKPGRRLHPCTGEAQESADAAEEGDPISTGENPSGIYSPECFAAVMRYNNKRNFVYKMVVKLTNFEPVYTL